MPKIPFYIPELKATVYIEAGVNTNKVRERYLGIAQSAHNTTIRNRNEYQKNYYNKHKAK